MIEIKKGNSDGCIEYAENTLEIELKHHMWQIFIDISLGDYINLLIKCLYTGRFCITQSHMYTYLTTFIFLYGIGEYQGHLAQAISIHQEAIIHISNSHKQLLPTSARIYIELGKLYYESNQIDRAYQHIENGIKKDRI